MADLEREEAAEKAPDPVREAWAQVNGRLTALRLETDDTVVEGLRQAIGDLGGASYISGYHGGRADSEAQYRALVRAAAEALELVDVLCDHPMPIQFRPQALALSPRLRKILAALDAVGESGDA